MDLSILVFQTNRINDGKVKLVILRYKQLMDRGMLASSWRAIK